MTAVITPSDLTSGTASTRLVAGDQAIEFEWPDIAGNKIKLSDYRGEKVLLAFYRFAFCPFCNLRLNMLSKRRKELEDRGLKIIAFIQSPLEAVRKTSDRHNTPFPILADYDKEIYSQYGVVNRPAGMMSAILRRPLKIFRAILKGYIPYKIQGDPNLMPAEFLINPDGTIHTAHYGKDAGDHLSFEKLKSFAQR
jgi:peroxiredoxin